MDLNENVQHLSRTRQYSTKRAGVYNLVQNFMVINNTDLNISFNLISLMNNFDFISATDFELLFKILVLGHFKFESKFSIANGRARFKSVNNCFNIDIKHILSSIVCAFLH
jgi:hypothetical protein